ncbi:UNVERIFIED_CONTAM: ABC transporter ATP-binding protein [Spiribacter pallidus]
MVDFAWRSPGGGLLSKQTATPSSSIEINALVRRFADGHRALDGVDLDIAAGEFFTLLGPSGCGKTTLLRILAGLDTPSAGEVRIGGRAMAGVPAHRRSVNTVFQSYALFPHRNVRRNIAFGLEMQRLDAVTIEKRIDSVAGLTGITTLLDRPVDQLSGGQRQRVALARAVVNEPDVLLLDEPLSALDAGLRGRLQLELRELQHRLGMTFVFVTHDQQEAMIMSDRIAVLDRGRIAQVGTPPAIYEQPATRFVAEFMGHENLLAVTGRDEHGVITPIGHFAGAFAEGGHLLIRPEAISLGRRQAAGPSAIPAQVVGRVYRGGSTEYRIACGDHTLIARASDPAAEGFEPGAEVNATVAPAGLAVVAG